MATTDIMLTTLTTKRIDGVMLANAGFSAGSAAAMLIFADPLSDWMTVPNALLLTIGAALGLFAGFVAWVARRAEQHPKLVGLIAAADLLWVGVATAIILLPGTLSGGGKAALSIVSVMVLDFGILQWMGYRKMATAA